MSSRVREYAGSHAVFLVFLVFLAIFLVQRPPTPLAGVTWDWETPLPQGNSITSVHGTGATDIIAVGGAGVILRYDGSHWDFSNVGNESFYGVWALSATDVFAVGSGGTILHFDGSEWTQMASPTTESLHSIWATSPSNVLTAGDKGVVLRFDGSSWSQLPVPKVGLVALSIRTVWCSGPTDIFVGGFGSSTSNGYVFHYDGSSWSQNWTFSNVVTDLWGPAPDDLVAGSGLSAYHYDGANWSTLGSISVHISGIGGISTSDFYVTGSTLSIIAHYDGTQFVEETITPPFSGTAIYHVPGGPLVAVGRYGQMVWNAGTGWELYPECSCIAPCDFLTDLNDVWEVGPDAVFVVGSAGPSPVVPLAYKYDGTTWTDISAGLPTTNKRINSVWATSVDRAWAGTDAGIYFYDGTSWTLVSATSAFDVWGVDENNIFAVGGFPWTAAYFDGTSWVSESTSEVLNGVWGSSASDVWAVGDNGLIMHYDGTWAEVPSPTDSPLLTIWGNSPTDIYAGGGLVVEIGTIVHYDGTGWTLQTPVPLQFGYEVTGLWARSPTQLYAVGTLEMFLYDGTDWTKQQPGSATFFLGISGTQDGDIFVVGSGGHIIHGHDDSAAHVGDIPAAAGAIASIRSHPNPFNPTVDIEVRLDRAANLRVDIFGVDGSHVRTLLPAQAMHGTVVLRWDGTNDEGSRLPSGVYFVRSVAGAQVMSTKAVLLK